MEQNCWPAITIGLYHFGVHNHWTATTNDIIMTVDQAVLNVLLLSYGSKVWQHWPFTLVCEMKWLTQPLIQFIGCAVVYGTRLFLGQALLDSTLHHIYLHCISLPHVLYSSVCIQYRTAYLSMHTMKWPAFWHCNDATLCNMIIDSRKCPTKYPSTYIMIIHLHPVASRAQKILTLWQQYSTEEHDYSCVGKVFLLSFI